MSSSVLINTAIEHGIIQIHATAVIKYVLLCKPLIFNKFFRNFNL